MNNWGPVVSHILTAGLDSNDDYNTTGSANIRCSLHGTGLKNTLTWLLPTNFAGRYIHVRECFKKKIMFPS